MRLSIAECRAQRIRERNRGGVQTGPYWALVDLKAREVVYAFDLHVQAREHLQRYNDDGCRCVLKRCETLAEVIGWHEPFTGEDEIARRERGQDMADFETVQ